MEVKPGYKKTEVGLIPEEWSIKPLSDVVDFLDSRRRPVKDNDRAKIRGDIPYYGASGIVDYVNAFLFDEDLILIGEDGENILSRNCRLAFKISGKTWVNNHAHVLRPKPGMSIDYLTEFLESCNYEGYNTGTAQPKLNKFVCSLIPIVCPTLPEQRAIAGALRDVDALIEALDKLIAKKRDLKQAAMQQILTGQKRLPGFHGAWGIKRIDDLGYCFAGGTPSTIRKDYWGGNIFWLPSGRVQNNILRAPINSEITITQLGLNESSTKNIKAHSVLIAITGATCANVAILDFEAAANQSVVAVEPYQQTDYRFLYYALLMERKKILSLQNGSAQGGINLKTVKSMTLYCPLLVEQIAIAEVLSDMDAELAALDQRRDKTRALKQGMMQELLTGRIRLV